MWLELHISEKKKVMKIFIKKSIQIWLNLLLKKRKKQVLSNLYF